MAIITDIYKDNCYWVWVGCGNQNNKYYEDLGYEIPKVNNDVKRGTKILVKVDDLPMGSGMRVTKVCDVCPVDSPTRIIPNQKYEAVLKYRNKTDGKDRCVNCTRKYIIPTARRNNVKYEKSAEYYCKQNKLDHIINEFSSKNTKKMSGISYGSADKYLWNCPIWGEKHEYDMSMCLRANQNIGCPYCYGRRVNETNCLSTTHPHIAKLLCNPGDGFIYTFSSQEKVDWKCPDCGLKIKNKRIADITRQRLSCQRCADGVSYPEKFVTNVLLQLDVEFERQKNFDWLSDKKYDFYILPLDCIIEVHGGQHYKNYFAIGRSLMEEQKNDDTKEQLAKENGISKYIIINAQLSELEYIRDNLIQSELSAYFNFSQVDWLKCHEYACRSLVKIACDLWNDGKNIKEICEILKLSYNTIKSYLKQGSKINLCNYDVNEQKLKSRFVQRPIVRFDMNGNFIDEFQSIHEASRQTGVSVTNIWNPLNGKSKSAGGYKWKYKC